MGGKSLPGKTPEQTLRHTMGGKSLPGFPLEQTLHHARRAAQAADDDEDSDKGYKTSETLDDSDGSGDYGLKAKEANSDFGSHNTALSNTEPMDDTRVKNAEEIKKSLSANKERMNSLKQLSRKKAQSLDDDLYEDEENQASEEDNWEDAVKEPSKGSKRAERYEKHSKQGISKKTQNRISAMEKSHKSEELSDESDCPGKYSQADDVELSLVAAGGKKKTEPRTAPNNGRHKGRKLIKWGVHADQLLLLIIQYECAKHKINLPMQAIADRFAAEKGASSQSVIQHLSKLRLHMLDSGRWVPPLMGRTNQKLMYVDNDPRGIVKYRKEDGTFAFRDIDYSEDASRYIDPAEIRGIAWTRTPGGRYRGHSTENPAPTTMIATRSEASGKNRKRASRPKTDEEFEPSKKRKRGSRKTPTSGPTTRKLLFAMPVKPENLSDNAANEGVVHEVEQEGSEMIQSLDTLNDFSGAIGNSENKVLAFIMKRGQVLSSNASGDDMDDRGTSSSVIDKVQNEGSDNDQSYDLQDDGLFDSFGNMLPIEKEQDAADPEFFAKLIESSTQHRYAGQAMSGYDQGSSNQYGTYMGANNSTLGMTTNNANGSFENTSQSFGPSPGSQFQTGYDEQGHVDGMAQGQGVGYGAQENLDGMAQVHGNIWDYHNQQIDHGAHHDADMYYGNFDNGNFVGPGYFANNMDQEFDYSNNMTFEQFIQGREFEDQNSSSFDHFKDEMFDPNNGA